jgi:hypothetical protein
MCCSNAAWKREEVPDHKVRFTELQLAGSGSTQDERDAFGRWFERRYDEGGRRLEGNEADIGVAVALLYESSRCSTGFPSSSSLQSARDDGAQTSRGRCAASCSEGGIASSQTRLVLPVALHELWEAGM